MKKLMPTFLLSIFAFAVILRFGQVSFEYYDYWYVAKAQAAEVKKNKENTKSTHSSDNSSRKLLTIQDRILRDTNNNNTNFSSKAGSKVLNKDPNKVCITGFMLENAKKQIEYLKQRENTVKEQLKLLETSDRRIREQISKLKLIKDDIVESAKLADSKIHKESKRLISIYEKMKPKEAANIFNEMDPNIAAELLRTMKENQSSAILAKMNPKIAYNVTLSLTGTIKDTKETYNKIK